MDKKRAIELLKQYIDEVPPLKQLPFDNEEYELWLSKCRTVIYAGLTEDDIKTFRSYSTLHVQGLFQPQVYQQDYEQQLKDYEISLKAIIQ